MILSNDRKRFIEVTRIWTVQFASLVVCFQRYYIVGGTPTAFFGKNIQSLIFQSSFSHDAPVETKDESDEKQHVENSDAAHAATQSYDAPVGRNDKHLEREYHKETGMHAEAGMEALVVDVRLVGVEHGLAMDDAHGGHAHQVETGHGEQGEGSHNRHHLVAAYGYGTVVHHYVAYGHKGEGKTKREAARIAHKGLCALLGSAKHVEQPECGNRAYEREAIERVEVHALVHEQQAEAGHRQHEEA